MVHSPSSSASVNSLTYVDIEIADNTSTMVRTRMQLEACPHKLTRLLSISVKLQLRNYNLERLKPSKMMSSHHGVVPQPFHLELPDDGGLRVPVPVLVWVCPESSALELWGKDR